MFYACDAELGDPVHQLEHQPGERALDITMLALVTKLEKTDHDGDGHPMTCDPEDANMPVVNQRGVA